MINHSPQCYAISMIIETLDKIINRLWIIQNIDLIIRCIERAEIVISSWKECQCDIGIFETYINFDSDEYITLNCLICDKEICREDYYQVIYGY